MPGTSPAPSDYVPPESHAPLLVPGAEPVPGYVLVRPLGKGGFGEVWRATAPGGFPVAMKFVTLSGEAGATELRSLDVLRELRHPNVLPVFGAWQTSWRLTMAMELADGTLLDRLKEAQAEDQAGIPGPELLVHLRGAAAGLDYLHSRKLQHRDVKPQNLLLVGGAVKVADFGQVRALKESSTKHTSGYTMFYAPPEFFRERVSRHSDQYSLAVAYCELRGGRLPFTGNQYELMAKHTEGAPDLSMLPEAERSILIRALAKEPGERWPSCGAFAEAVGRAMTGQGKPAAVIELLPPPPPPRRRGVLAVLLGLAVVAAGAGVALWPKGGTPATTDGESPVVAAKPDTPAAPGSEPPKARPVPTAPEPTGKSATPTGTPDADIRPKPKPEPPKPPADDGKTFVSQATGMRFVRIKAGSFRMGSPDSDTDAHSDEKPQPEVTLTKDFYLGIYEVTRIQFHRFVDDTGYKTEGDWLNPGFDQTDDHPVVNVSWNDAVRFAEWLSTKDGQACRLPTEAEWEYSCRGGATSRYHFGDDPKDLPRYANFNQEHGGTTPVGKFSANPFHLHDMHGNVWEWCADWFGDYPPGRITDPTVFATGSYRARRGGGWNLPARRVRSAYRNKDEPSYRNDNLGFRLARVPFSQ